MKTKQFTLYLENKPGSLSAVMQDLSKDKINIDGISVASSPDVGLVQLVTNDVAKTRDILTTADIAYTEQEVVIISVENRPGALFDVVRKLSKKKVNINYIYATATADKSDSSKSCVIISSQDLDKVNKIVG